VGVNFIGRIAVSWKEIHRYDIQSFPPRRLSFALTTVFQEVRHVHQGKDSSSHRCSHRHWSGIRQGAPAERGTGQLQRLNTRSCNMSG